jgi:hypothetical protein
MMTPDETKLIADQVVAQAAQQIAEQVGQAVSQAIQKFMQTTGAVTVGASEGSLGARTTGQAVGERIEDIGGGEAHEAALNALTQMNHLNMKRTYDAYQEVSLESIKRNRTYVDKVLSDALQYDNQRQVIANQALQNAVETSNMVGKNAVVNLDNVQKQHTAHRDIATDGLWNPVQQGAGDTLTARAVSIDDASLKAIGALVATALADALKPKS